MSKSEVPPFISMASKSFENGSDFFLLHLKHFQRARFSEVAKHFLPEESWIPSLRHLYRSIPKPLTTSENVVLLSEASPYPSVCDLVVLLLQTWSFALSFNGIVVSLGCPSSACVQRAQKCAFTNCLTVLQKSIL